jgi:hypothetical protein
LGCLLQQSETESSRLSFCYCGCMELRNVGRSLSMYMLLDVEDMTQ